MTSTGVQPRIAAGSEVASLYPALFDDAPYGLLTTDREGSVLAINPTAQSYFACASADAQGTAVDHWLSNGSEQLRAFLSAKRAGASARYECVGRRLDGVEIPLEVVLSLSGQGADGVVIFTLTDLSLRYSAERLMNKTLEQSALANQALANANKSLDQKNRELNALAYAVAHDLKAPMVNILGFSAELTRHCADLDVKLPEARMAEDPQLGYIVRDGIPQALAFINQAANRMDSHLNAILRLAYLNAYKMVSQQVELAEIVRAAEAKYQCPSDSIELLCEDVPPLWIDREAMTVIVEELVSNARKFSSRERPLKIAVQATVAGDSLNLCVADNGIGIAQNHIGQISYLFRRFAEQDTDGVGMGLSYVHALLTRLDGTMQCESELGRGTEIKISVPIENCLSKDFAL